MAKISYGQLFSILLATRIFSFTSTQVEFSTEQMLGMLISTLIQGLLLIPTFILYSNPKFSLNRDIFLGKYSVVMYSFCFIIWGAHSFTKFWNVTKSVYIPLKSELLVSILIVIVCVYVASLGLKAIARGSAIVFGITILSVIILVFGAYRNIDWLNILPVSDYKSIGEYALYDFSASGEIAAIFILLSYIGENKIRGVLLFLGGKTLYILSISVIGVVVLGRVMGIVKFPFFSLVAFSQPFSIQRADTIYVILYTLVGVISITIQSVITADLLKILIPKIKFASIISVIIMMFIAWGITNLSIDLSWIYNTLIIITAFLIPLLTLISQKKNAGGVMQNET